MANRNPGKNVTKTFKIKHTRVMKERANDVVWLTASDGKRMSAHRLVLGYFEYFAALLETGEPEFYIPDVNGETLQQLLQYCYTGKLELRRDNVDLLFYAANSFSIEAIAKMCTTYSMDQLNISNTRNEEVEKEDSNKQAATSDCKKRCIKNNDTSLKTI